MLHAKYLGALALAIFPSCVSMKPLAPSTTGPFVTATYEVPNELHDEFIVALKGAETTLRAEGLITEFPAIRMRSRGNENLILEVFQWTDDTSFGKAQQMPSVLEHWGGLEKLWSDGGFGLGRFPESKEFWAQYDVMN